VSNKKTNFFNGTKQPRHQKNHRTKIQSEKSQKKITNARWFFLYHIARRDAESNTRSKKPMRGWHFQ
jgi:hypothetical protein